ncbi:MAG: serine hydrolase domain-containing protein [Pseudomonadales bacterium]|nr:beta-lactamase family protein [Pseudomonadales bacterium]
MGYLALNDIMYPVHGFVAPGFERVREVFEANFVDDVEVGASFCVFRDSEPLVDLWGGYKDPAGREPWQSDTLVNVYSTTKGVAALAFATLVEEGLIGFDDPVREYWPELKAGRDGLTVAQLLSHQGGLCGVDQPLTVSDLLDWDRMVGLLAQQAPYWKPGTDAGYHAVTWGYLPGELCRRITGESLGGRLARCISAPLGADFFLGLPASGTARIAPMIGPNRARKQPDMAQFADMKMPALYPVALQNPTIRPYQDASSAAWQRAEIAAANGQANARGIARIYAAAAAGLSAKGDGSVGLSSRTLAALTRQQVGERPDLVLGRPMRRGAGVILNTDAMFGPGLQSFGHSGAGGSTGFADPQARLGVGYAMNQMQFNLDEDSRGGRLIRAFYDCLRQTSTA